MSKLITEAARDVGGDASRPVPVHVLVAGMASNRAGLQRMFDGPVVPRTLVLILALRPDTAMDELDALAADLERWSGLPTRLVDCDTTMQPGMIYLLRNDTAGVVDGGTLRLRPERQGEDGVIDSLAVSLATEKREAAVLVTLAGLAQEATLGSTSIKQHGGLTLVEADGGQHQQGTLANLEDEALPAAEIMPRVQAHAAFLLAHNNLATIAADSLSSNLDRIVGALKTFTGHDFHGYKQATFQRRVVRRMQVLQIGELPEYADQLQTSPAEVQLLFQDLLIGVTRFFRDPAEFDLLARDVIPGLFAGKGRNTKVRVWTLGCATGEEAYSLGILLREHAATLADPPDIQIFATDIDNRALAAARAGRFAETISRDVTPERLNRWFVREGSTYVVSKQLREMCVFSAHNILRDPPFSRIDLISCRNLMIYLNADVQDRIMPLFHFALRGDGVLFLGPSENISRHSRLFGALDRQHRVFRRHDVEGIVLPALPLVARGAPAVPPGNSYRPSLDGPDLVGLADRVVRRHSPAYVVVDSNLESLHFSGRVGRYLSPSPGAATLNLLSLVYRELRVDLRALVHRAGISRAAETSDRIFVAMDSGYQVVKLTVEPLTRPNDNALYFVVMFQDMPDRQAVPTPASADPQREQQLQQAETELLMMRERLQAALEEQETTNEELKASNEEYQSLNEELQSANEELETSKEELQSVNEELHTVNAELDNGIKELAHINSDLRNVLESTQIAVMFLDADLRIKSFTPALTEVFHLLDTDKGRPITHIGARIDYPELENDVRKVLRTLVPAEREIGTPRSGQRYLVRVLPYRSVDNFIAGAVVTFLDVTATVRAELALRASEERFRRMAQSVPVFLFTADPSLAWDYVSPPFYDYTGLNAGSAAAMGWLRAVHPDDVEASHLPSGIISADAVFERELRLRSADKQWRWFLIRAVPQSDQDGAVTGWFGSGLDIHERRNGEARQRLLMAELQHRVKNILAVVRSVVSRTRDSSTNLEEFVDHLTGRIGALARTQSVLARSGDQGVGLEDLVLDELDAHGGQNNLQVRVSGPPVLLNDKIAETLGLALHELTTNSIKYGALASPGGHVNVAWRTYTTDVSGHPEQRLVLDWQEAGVPVTDLRPARSGFGRELIERGLPYDLGATTALDFRPGGVRCVIELALVGMPDPTSFLDETVT